MGGVKLTRNLLDPAGNRNSGWAVGEKRGGKDYDSPQGWNGIGLKVKGKYDNGDDTWIGMNNSPQENGVLLIMELDMVNHLIMLKML